VSGVLFDTSVYISARRQRRLEVLDAHRYGEELVYLSAVVGQELYIGAATRVLRRQVDRLWHGFEQVGRLLAPTTNDWRDAGLLLSRIGEQLGYERVRQGRLTNDALLALSARRYGLTVLTLNAGDFSLLARFRPFRFVVVNPDAVGP
jgi:predicted nucleic acid-binding protein